MITKLLKKLLCGIVVFTALPLPAQMKAPSLDNLRINGMLMYDNNRSEDVLGFYEYSVTAPVSRRALVLSPRNYLSGDAVVVDGKLYTYHLEVQYGYVNSAFYTVIDVATGEAVKSQNISWDLGAAYSHYATSAALNAVDGKVYCSGYEYNEADKTLTPTLKIWNVRENSKETVGTMQASLAVMAFDKAGNLYGITGSSSRTADDGGRLVKVDTATGSLTIVGDTGVRPWFDQSGVISPYDGRLYWFANEIVPGGGANDAYARLYAVDTATAAAECIGDMPEGDEVVAAWIPAQTIDDAAPGVVSGVTPAFTAPSLAGTINFTLPSKSYSGAALDGSLDWSVSAGDKVFATGRGTAGASVSADVTVEKSGPYFFEVSAANGAGAGVPVRTEAYVGYGVPAPVGAVTFAVEDGRHVVTWDHVTALAAGAYLEGGHASYRVVRQPGDVLLHENLSENRFEEPALDGAIQATYYEITAVNGDMSAAATRSNSVVTGSTVALPFTENFEDQSALGLFTINDANNDGTTWAYYSYGKAVQIRQSTSADHDDWLVLPKAMLEAGYSYELKFSCYANVASYVNILDVAMGADPADMSETLASDIEVTGARSSSMKEVSVVIKPERTAAYNIGIHIKSAKRQGTFSIKNVSLSAGQSTAIPAAPSVVATAAPEGALAAVLTIGAPTLTAGGDALANAVTGFEIMRDGTPLATIDAEAGKTEYTYEDRTVDAAGLHTYTVCAVNADGKGETAEAAVYVGRDLPAAPAGFVAIDNFDGTVTLSWAEPSATGLNGGYVDTARLVYSVTDSDKNVTEGLRGTSAKSTIAKTGDQKAVTYILGVKYDDDAAMKEQTAESNTLVAGAPYMLPFAETFANGAAGTQLWTKEPVRFEKSYDLEFSVSSDSDHGGDGAGLKVYSYANNTAGRWISPGMDLSQSVNPELTMWVKMFSLDASFELQVQKEYGEWETVATVDPSTEWVELKAPLSAYRGRFVRLGLTGVFAKGYNGVYMDDIAVRESTSGIDGVAAPGTTGTEIYNVQGLRVSDTAAPGVYIVRKGGEVRKVIVR